MDWETRKRAREDLVRVTADHERKQGRHPNIRELERDANARADRLDRQKEEKNGR